MKRLALILALSAAFGAAHAAGLAVLAWTVNDLATARRLRTLGVDALCTDAPDELAAG